MFVMNFHGRWDDPADDERCIRWAREFFNASAPFASGGVYVNFLTADEGVRVRNAYGPNYDRLAQVKGKYDPENLFRMNQNIKPDRGSKEVRVPQKKLYQEVGIEKAPGRR
jgi:FAD/FMN-containing dehydrogenase